MTSAEDVTMKTEPPVEDFDSEEDAVDSQVGLFFALVALRSRDGVSLLSPCSPRTVRQKGGFLVPTGINVHRIPNLSL